MEAQVPGNHDIGDNPSPGALADSNVDAARRQRWVDIVGADHWSVTAPWARQAVVEKARPDRPGGGRG